MTTDNKNSAFLERKSETQKKPKIRVLNLYAGIGGNRKEEIASRERMILLLGIGFTCSWLIAFIYNPILMSILVLLITLGVIAYV